MPEDTQWYQQMAFLFLFFLFCLLKAKVRKMIPWFLEVLCCSEKRFHNVKLNYTIGQRQQYMQGSPNTSRDSEIWKLNNRAVNLTF